MQDYPKTEGCCERRGGEAKGKRKRKRKRKRKGRNKKLVVVVLRMWRWCLFAVSAARAAIAHINSGYGVVTTLD